MPHPEHSLQLEFGLFGTADGTRVEFDPLGELKQSVSALWKIPLGQRVRVDLRDCEVSWIEGRLELAEAPDLPLDPRQVLALHIDMIYFSGRQIIAWASL